MIACKPAVLSQMRLDKTRVRFNLTVEIAFLYALSQQVTQRSQAERHRRFTQTVKDQFHHQKRHQRPFGVMQPEAILGFMRRILRFKMRRRIIGFLQVFKNCTRFREDQAVIFYYGRFPQRVDFLKRRRCQHGFLALIANNLIRHAEFFERPDHAL
ncbi:hypothetical protein D3C78_1524660 [compost metagenome]